MTLAFLTGLGFGTLIGIGFTVSAILVFFLIKCDCEEAAEPSESPSEAADRLLREISVESAA